MLDICSWVGYIFDIFVVRDQEITNAQKQIDTNNYELTKLQEKLEQLSGVDKLLQLEQRMKEALATKGELEKQIK